MLSSSSARTVLPLGGWGTQSQRSAKAVTSVRPRPPGAVGGNEGNGAEGGGKGGALGASVMWVPGNFAVSSSAVSFLSGAKAEM